MKLIHISNHPKYPANLTAIQESGCALVLLKLTEDTNKIKSYTPIGSSTTCKDFIGDGLYYNFVGLASSYCSTDEIEGPTIIGFGCFNNEVAAAFHKKLKLINNLEKRCGVPLTSFEVSGQVVIATADPFWRSSTLAISTFIQLCRFCLTPSTCRSILTQIKKVAETDSARDQCYAKELLNSPYLDLVFLIKNMDKVVGNNPFTDYDDAQVKGSQKGNFTFTRDVWILGKHFVSACNGGANNHHSTHGICAFANNIRRLTTSKEVTGSHQFFSRVANYINLLPKSKVKPFIHLFQ